MKTYALPYKPAWHARDWVFLYLVMVYCVIHDGVIHYVTCDDCYEVKTVMVHSGGFQQQNH